MSDEEDKVLDDEAREIEERIKAFGGRPPLRVVDGGVESKRPQPKDKAVAVQGDGAGLGDTPREQVVRFLKLHADFLAESEACGPVIVISRKSDSMDLVIGTAYSSKSMDDVTLLLGMLERAKVVLLSHLSGE